MISALSIGSAEIPESAPAEPVEVVVPIVPTMPETSYDVAVLRPASLPEADVVITSQTTTDVTLTVTRPDGFAGTPGLTVHLLCTEDLAQDRDWQDATPYLDAGWTATIAQLWQVGPVVYFQFDLTATAAIDGITRATAVHVLDLTSLPTYQPLSNGVIGACFTDSNQLMKASLVGNVVDVEAAAGTTGSWADGSTYLFGQVSWMAGVV